MGTTRKKFSKHFATVFVENGYHKLMLPSGEVIPHLIETVTVDSIEYSKVTLTAICNVVSNKEEALKKYDLSE